MKTLFDLPPLARNKDPISSYEAGEEVVESGRIHTQAQEVLAALTLRPGLSSKTLAEISGLNRYTVARRLPGLRYRGLAQNCPKINCTRGCERNDVLCSVGREYMVRVPGDKFRSLRWWPRA
jgi:hypothetical protein